MAGHYIPMYHDDWLSGVAELTPAEVGVYINMLMKMSAADGPIKADYNRLARGCNCPLATFTRIVESLIEAEKLTLIDGHLFNNRIAIELEKRSQKRQSASESASLRWAKKPTKSKADDMRTHSKRNANQNHNQNYNHNSVLKDESFNTLTRASDDIFDLTPDTVSPMTECQPSKKQQSEADFARFWEAYPKRSNNPKKPAKKKFEIAALKVSPEIIIHGARAYAEWCLSERTEDKYIAQAQTWLNQERWTNVYREKTFEQQAKAAGYSDWDIAAANLISEIRANG